MISLTDEVLQTLIQKATEGHDFSNMCSHYAENCIPAKLKEPTGKAKKCAFEEILPNIYEHDAHMVAFRVVRDRLFKWIRALGLFYYEYLGNNKDLNITWSDDPLVLLSPDDLKTISIEVIDSEENNLIYKITVFIKTGTIQAQGSGFKKFQSRDFPILKHIIDKFTGLVSTNDSLLTVDTSEQCMDDDPTLLKTTYSKSHLPLSTNPDDTQPKIVTKKDIQFKEKKTTHAISNQKSSVDIDHEPENVQGYISVQLEELKKFLDKDKSDLINRMEQNLKNAVDKIHTQTTTILKERLNEINMEYNQRHEERVANIVGKFQSSLDEKCSITSKSIATDDKKQDLEIKRLKDKVSSLETRNTDLQRKLETHEYQKTLNEDKVKYEKSAHENTKKLWKQSSDEANREIESLSAKLAIKDKNINEFEQSIKYFKRLISD